MASRVNVRFVVGLVAVLVVVTGGVVGAVLWVVNKTGEDYAVKGDAFAAAGDYEEAAKMYGRAVGHDRSNVEWLTKWRDANAKRVPDKEVDHRNLYDQQFSILAQLATVQYDNVQAQDDFLSEMYQRVKSSPFDRSIWDQMIEQTETSLAGLEDDPDVDPSWRRLRRYRGMALVRIMMQQLRVPKEKVALAKEDLEAALEVDPDDVEATTHLLRWHILAAQRAAKASDTVLQQQERQAGRTLIEAFIQSHPDDPLPRVLAFELRMENVLMGVDQSLVGAELTVANEHALESLGGELQELVAWLRRADPAKITNETVNRFQRDSSLVDPEHSDDLSLEVVDLARQARPNDASLMFFRANRLSQMNGRGEEALEWYQKVVDMPPLPLGLEGLVLWQYKPAAYYKQGNVAFRLYDAATTDEERQRWLSKAKEYRAKLAGELTERDPRLLMLDARIRLAGKERAGALDLLQQYNEATNHQDPEGLRMEARVAIQMNRMGEAKEMYEKVLEIQPYNYVVMDRLAGVEQGLKNTERAIQLLERATALNPGNEERLRRLQVLLALEGKGQMDDPVTQTLVEAERLLSGTETGIPDRAGAIALLQERLEPNGFDPRLVDSLARIQFVNKDEQGARQTIETGLEHHPDDESLLALRDQLGSEDPIAYLNAQVDKNERMTPLDKLLAKFRNFRAGDRAEEAAQVLAEAKALAPDAPQVIEYLFQEALKSQDMAEAGRLAEQAARVNADQADGLTFRARLEFAQGRFADSASTLEIAAQQGGVSASTWRLLGALQMELGRGPDAISSYERALEIRPDDIVTINTYIASLASLGRLEDALSAARESEQYGRGNKEFRERWLTLEASVGDKQFAASRRNEIFKKDPDDVENRMALVSLLIDLRMFDLARTHLDEMRKAEDSLDLVALDARWYADRGQMDRAREVFADYIFAQDRSTMTARPYLVFGRFMIDRNQIESGLAALNQARKYQDPEKLEADHYLADTYFRLGRWEEALAAYTALHTALPEDPNHAVTKRMIESLSRLKRYKEAMSLLNDLGPAVIDGDVSLMLLQADANKGLGDVNKARQLLDRTVAKFPSDPLPYLKRAEAMQNDSDLAQDALSDVDAALRLRPNMWQAYRLRARLHTLMGDLDAAIEDLRAATAAAPEQDDLRVAVMHQFLSEGRTEDAIEVAKAAIERHPSNMLRIISCGNIFAGADDWANAARFYGQAWELNRNEQVTYFYVDALLRADPPDLNRASKVLQAVSETADASPLLRMVRARLGFAMGNPQAAVDDTTNVYDLVRDDPNKTRAWFNELRKVLPDMNQLVAYLQQLEQTRGTLPDSLMYYAGAAMLEDDSTRALGISNLEKLGAASKDPGIRVASFQSLSDRLYQDGRYQEAAKWMRAGLKIRPDNTNLNNNLAYTLTAHLGQAQEGLSYAKKAAEQAPDSGHVLDTLGYAYLALGRNEEAAQTLTKALNAVSSDADKTLITVHLGQAKAGLDDLDGARKLAREARTLLPLVRGQERERVEQALEELEGRLKG